MRIRTITVKMLWERCYLLIDKNNEAVIIDPGGDGQKILKVLDEEQVKLKAILITHGHFDHIGAVQEIKAKTGAEVIAHEEGEKYLREQAYNLSTDFGMDISFEADRYVTDKEQLRFNESELEFEVIHVPGHTADSVAYYHQETDSLFSGDIIFKLGIGRTDFPGSDSSKLAQGIKERIFSLPSQTTIHPGHGFKTMVEFERERNPYIT